MKPIILISASVHDANDPLLKYYRINALYAHCIAAAGATPILACGECAKEYVNIADGILFSGGPDINPSYYNESVINDTVSVNTDRDKEEMALFSEFYHAGKPIFGICRGIQLINTAMGGSLYQDIPSQIKTDVIHAANGTHCVDVSGSLKALFGKDRLVVNSYHHQCIKTPAPGLHVNAVSEDNIIEGVESDCGRILAVQWHPERITGPDLCGEREDMMSFFEEIVRRVKGYGK